jgi:predicted XRE-type DNA-binding protein
MGDWIMRGKKSFMQWIDEQLDRDTQLRRQVEEALSEMRIEQDLVALREESGLSQRQVAKMIGVTQPAIAKIESGKVKNIQLKTLVQFATALGGSVKVKIVKDRPRTKVLALRSKRRRLSHAAS